MIESYNLDGLFGLYSWAMLVFKIMSELIFHFENLGHDPAIPMGDFEALLLQSVGPKNTYLRLALVIVSSKCAQVKWAIPQFCHRKSDWQRSPSCTLGRCKSFAPGFGCCQGAYALPILALWIQVTPFGLLPPYPSAQVTPQPVPDLCWI